MHSTVNPMRTVTQGGGGGTAITVTATLSSGQTTPNAPGILLQMFVLTGGTETGGANAAASNTAQVTLTPAATGSLLVWATASNNGTGAFGSAAAGNSFQANFAATGFVGIAAGYFTGTVTSGTGCLCGTSITSGAGAICAYEIERTGGTTPAIDASTPAFAQIAQAAGQSVTSASFTPPHGSVLVACVAADGTNFNGVVTFSVADSSSLTWTGRGQGTATVQGYQGEIYTATAP